MSALLVALISLFAAVILRVFQLGYPTGKKKHPYPPGPKALPLVGNIRDVPTVKAWLTYFEWAKQHGDIIHISMAGRHIVIISSVKVATDLFEKRSRIYSDRPDIPMANLMGWDMSTTLQRYGDEWRIHRRIFHEKYRPNAVVTARPLQLSKTRELLKILLKERGDFAKYARNYAASIVMYITYGHKISPEGDRLVQLADEAGAMISESVFPGAQIVNTFPMLRYLPDWFPGTGFKKYAQRCRDILSDVRNSPFDVVRERMESGTAEPSLTSEFLERNEGGVEDKIDEEMLKSAAATSFAAGADTTAAALRTFVLTMMHYPEVQKRAQKEIDAVVGNSRLPNFDDRDSLHYVEAVFRELFRYQPVTPLGVTHATVADDIYEGYLIPKGSMVIANIWAMTHDDRVYNDPDEFRPERFLTPNGTLNSDSTILTFGFGRRICAGRHLADASVWIGMVSILSVFNIAKEKDTSGCDVEITGEFTDGVISFPPQFACSISPRSDEARKLIVDAVVEI